MIHFADVSKSERLQRVLSLLADGQEHTTMEIIHGANVCAVNSIITEIRRNGYEIITKDNGYRNGSRVYSYRWPQSEQVALNVR